MTISRARNGPIEIAYESFGHAEAEPILLVMGTGGQMLSWPDEFCRRLTDEGFAVARFDNRDAGLSTHLDHAGTPNQVKMLLRPSTVATYSLSDMAADAVAVMDDLHWERAHLVGMSQGGMIAQTVAAEHPSRVRTLTSISSTPDPKIGRPSRRTMARIVKAVNPKKVRTADDLADYLRGLDRVVGSPAYRPDDAELRVHAHRCHERGGLDMASLQRQTAAIAAAGDRRATLAGLRVPTLVLHGEEDPLIRPEAGRATAEMIPGARLVTYPGMGHDLPAALWPSIVEEIVSLTTGTMSPTPDDGPDILPRRRPERSPGHQNG